MPASPAKRKRSHARIVARAWQDSAFRRRLLRNPAKAFQEEGVRVPKGVKIHVHENKGRQVHLVIPRKPAQPKAQHPGNIHPDICWCIA